MTFADHLRTHQDAHNGGGEMPISYGSVCSGIEAASVAWHHLGWIPRWFAEIEPFPSAALAHHWPEVSNLGDFTAIRDKVTAGTVEAPDVLVGGTPCQAFSVAGLRQSLDDKRGQLTLEFVRLANAIDSARSFRGQRPVTVVWENVPGVLNTPDNAFGCFLAGLVGEDDPLVAPGGRWSNAGYVRGPKRTVAWRILDAQYFGVAQRRRRVFVVASAGGIRPEQVLFELEGVRRDSPPSRQAGQGIAHDVAPCLTSGGRGAERTGETRGQDPVVAVPETVGTITKQFGNQSMCAPEVDANLYIPTCATGEVFHTLRAEGFDAGEDGTRRGSGAIAVGFNARHDSSPCADRGMDVVALPINTQIATRGNALGRGTGFGIGNENDPGFTLQAEHSHAVAVGFNARQDPDSREDRTGPLDTDGGTQAVAVRAISQTLTSNYGKQVDSSDPGLGPNVVFPAMQVRRLTPTECERLQGFPDGHTRIPWRGKGADDCPDGPRYKALGNSMAVPVMRWIGARIARQLEAQA